MRHLGMHGAGFESLDGCGVNRIRDAACQQREEGKWMRESCHEVQMRQDTTDGET